MHRERVHARLYELNHQDNHVCDLLMHDIETLHGDIGVSFIRFHVNHSLEVDLIDFGHQHLLKFRTIKPNATASIGDTTAIPTFLTKSSTGLKLSFKVGNTSAHGSVYLLGDIIRDEIEGLLQLLMPLDGLLKLRLDPLLHLL